MKILLIDDHHLIREGLRPVLQQLPAAGERLEVIEASTFGEALVEIAKHPDFELVLLDLRLPDVQGFDALEQLQWRQPAAAVVIMSGDDDAHQVRNALARGALGYIPKSSTPGVILHALRLVLSGGVYVPPEIMQAAMSAPGAEARTDGVKSKLQGLNLTPRQADVLALLLAGKSNKQICRELDLAEGTVKAHVAAVFRALNVTTRVQAVVAAGKLGIKT